MFKAKDVLKALHEAEDKWLAQKQELAVLLKAPTIEKAVNRALILGIGPSCGRCGGTGHYSYNQMSGTTCFQCNGYKVVRANSKKSWDETLRQAQEMNKSGGIDKYLQTLKIRAEVKKLNDAWFKVWKESGVDKYNWHKLGDTSNQLFGTDYTDRDKKKINGSTSDWTMIDEHMIAEYFLSDVNGYYNVVSHLFSGISMSAEFIKDKATVQQQNEFFTLVQKAKEVCFGDIATKLQAMVHQVPTWAAAAKKGKPFPITTNEHGISRPVWIRQYAPKLPDFRKTKLVALVNSIVPGTYSNYKLTWPHETDFRG